MSPRILRALMQLFALFSSFNEEKYFERRKFVTSFLEEEILKDEVDEYAIIFDKFYNQYIKRKGRSRVEKEIASSSVKILSLCNILNEELTQQQKIVILIKLLEILRLEGQMSEQTREFITIIADSLKIPAEEFNYVRDFIFEPKENFSGKDRYLVISSKNYPNKNISHLKVDGLSEEIYVLYIKIQNLIIFYIDGNKEMYLNQRLLRPFRMYLLPYGYALRVGGIQPIYYSDILSNFVSEKSRVKIAFEADKISYKFRDNKIGVRPLSFIERNARLVGIMGASGSGKTTLISILNGTFTPTTGHVYINGIDLHQNIDKLKGMIGYVSQDDLLIEELTVFENLYFNAKLCLAGKTKISIIRRVIEVLSELGLYDIKDMRVGSVLDRRISGGQRKRLNIALELIRETPILFLDEPTSGLSSRDSENILDLLKTLTIDGKLVFVVIHQPSSYIFKMFDRLLVLDQGGYLIYNGKPIEAILYFKSAVREADWRDTVCPTCGNVNPEQIFNIIETRLLNEYGLQTQSRKFSPEDWYEKYNRFEETASKKKSYLVRKLPDIEFKVPSKIKQFCEFVKRDYLSKSSNLQYIAINLIEAPLMALILSFIIKYWSFEKTGTYLFFNNENVPIYIFMSVIIAIFVGLTVSAEEIFKDKKILKREKYLNLSRGSYLFSKTFILFVISTYQSLVYVLIGNGIIEIRGFYFEYWLVLFSVWFSANLMGLIISELFDSSTTIYIIIPFLVIPQLVLTGVLVPFNKLNPRISSPVSIPFYGEIFQARWAYEALSVKQFRDNHYNRIFYPYDKIVAEADYIKQYWCKTINNKVDEILRYKSIPEKRNLCIDNLILIRNELTSNHLWLRKYPIDFNINNLTIDNIENNILDSVTQYIEKLKIYYIEISNNIIDQKDLLINQLIAKDPNYLFNLKSKYHNEKLEAFLLGDRLNDQAVIYKNKIYCYYKPIFNTPENKFLKAIYYSPTKPFFHFQIDTFWFNVIVIWIISIIEFLFLYYSIFVRLANIIIFVKNKIKKKITFFENKKTKIKKRHKKFIKKTSKNES